MSAVINNFASMIYLDGEFHADPHPGNLMAVMADDGTARGPHWTPVLVAVAKHLSSTAHPRSHFSRRCNWRGCRLQL